MPAYGDRLARALEGRYRVERELGEGGMATVYLAEDLKHERRVAIKVLRPELAAVIGAKRFLAEIKTTAKLQHPHILPLFDSGDADGFLYYVMPYVEGDNLRDRIEREGQLGVEDAVRITMEVADALDYAHRSGIIHRDIKPANILLHDGRPVVADFGIALAISAAGGGRMTETGLSLGTPHYMSPEQASADRDLNARSDVYSLGCVLYEMLAGQPPHTGPSARSVLVRILTEEPTHVSELRRAAPAHVAAAVMKAIEKLPADRFHSASELGEALEDPTFRYDPAPRAAAASPGRAAPADATGRRSPWGPWLSDTRSRVAVGLVGLLALALGLATLLPEASGPAAGAPSYRVILRDSLDRLWPVVGPDGAVWINEELDGEDGNRFLVRRPGALGFVEVARARLPGLRIFTVSPDGGSLAFGEPREGENVLDVYALAVASGERTLLTSISGFEDGWITDWTPDGWIYGSALDPSDVLNFRIPEAGGPPDTIPLPHDPYAARTPTWMKGLPGGSGVLYNESTADGAAALLIAYDLETGDTTVVAHGALGVWSPTGHVVYGREGGFLDAVPFDPSRLEVTGDPVQVLAGMAASQDITHFELSASGALAYLAGSATTTGSQDMSLRLEWVDLEGNVEPLRMTPTDHADVAVSPDGSRIAYIRNGRVWIFRPLTGSDLPLRDDELGADEHDPTWSPNGTRLVFSSRRAAPGDAPSAGGRPDLDLYVQTVEGDEPAVRVGGTPGPDVATDWAEGGVVLFDAVRPERFGTGQQQDIYALDLDEPGSETALLRGEWSETGAFLSPDGEWMAYGSDESGRFELYVRRFPSMEDPLRVSEGATASVDRAVWGPGGTSVAYMVRDSLVVAELDLSGEDPQVVGRRPVMQSLEPFEDRDPSGRRFLRFRPESTVAEEEADQVPRLILATNWLDELRRTAREGG